MSTPRTDGPERRRHPRFAVDEVEVTVRRRGILGVRVGENIARGVVDLSEGGSQILATVPLPAGTPVHYVLRLAKFQDEFVSDGVVRWSRPDGRSARVGIEFTGLDDAARRKLALFRSYFTSPQVLARLREKRTGTLLLRNPSSRR
jgi:hypothetical protein